MRILETDRLVLSRLTFDDAVFILGLLNEPSFLRHIGDKKVRTLDDAREYLRTGPIASYDRNGYGLYRTTLKDGGAPIGICGLVKRDTLPDADVGFAFLPAHWRQGYAFESAAAVLVHAREALGLDRVVAVTSPDNEASIQLLEKLGLRFEKMIRLSGDSDDCKLFGPATAAD